MNEVIKHILKVSSFLCDHLTVWTVQVMLMISVFFEGVGNATACVMGDKIYVTGGHYGYRGSCTYEKTQVYKPDVNEWSIITISPHPGMHAKADQTEA